MAKLTLKTFASAFNSWQNLNFNNTATSTAMENTLSRDGTAPNQMGAVLDMNSNRIINLVAPVYPTEPVRLSDLIAGSINVTVSAFNSWSSPAISIATTAPGGPAVDDRYRVAHSGTTGVFVGHEDSLAVFTTSGWQYLAPKNGQEVYVQSTLSQYIWNGTGWSQTLTILKPGDNVQSAFTNASGGWLLVVAGTYTGVGITIPSNTKIDTSGKVIFQTTSNTVPIWDLTNSTGVLIRGLWKLQGNGPGNTDGVGASNSGQVAIKTFNTIGLDIDGFIEICNIQGYGIDEHAPASTFRQPGNNSFRGLRVHDNFFGAYVRDFSEYSTYSNSWFYNNVACIKDEAGNRSYINVMMQDSQYGLFLDGTVETGNNSHGIVSGCFINHNTNNIVCDTTQFGMLFTGCQILSDTTGSGKGVISIINGSKLINFTGCDIGSTISISATSQALGVGNTVRTTLADPPVITSGGVWTGIGNVTTTGLLSAPWNQ